MLRITIPETEFYDEEKGIFFTARETQLDLEHSLVSLSKWESIWNKPFISEIPKTAEETISYIKCMTLNKNTDPLVYSRIPPYVIDEAERYIDLPMTATTFCDDNKPTKTIITAEIIYYWMISLSIPFECRKWHLNRLFTLIKVCSIKNNPPKKMSKNAVAAKYRELNAARRKKHNTRR